MVRRSCSDSDIRAALAELDVVEVEWAGAAALALADLAESEEMLADGLAGLAAENRLAVVVGALSAGRSQALATALGGAPAVVLDDAHLLGVDDVLAAVEDLPEDSVLALSLDPALPLTAAPGAIALDLAASGVCPVLRATAPPARTALARARVDVAAGHWFGTSAEDRSLVEVRVGGAEEALVRVGQLVGTSIPRAFEVHSSRIGVLLAPGSLDAGAVREALTGAGVSVAAAGSPGDGARVVELSGPLDRGFDAVVLVLGPPGPALTRALVYSGLVAGDTHVSVVHGSDPAALTAAIGGAPDRPRRTRLAALLAG